MASSHSKFRQGFVYTLCILFVTGALLEMLAYQAEWSGRRLLDIQPPNDGEVLLYRLDELSWMTRQAIGLNATLARNSSHLTLNFSDAGFPLTNYTNGSVQITPLKAWLEANWTGLTRTALRFNVTEVNDTHLDPVYTGQLLRTSGGIHYEHTNFYSDRDIANLTLPASADTYPDNLTVELACSRPANTSTITYTSLGASGSGMNATIFYADPLMGAPYSTTDEFSPGGANAFAANYTDADGLWLQTIHVDWVAPSYSLLIWDEGNTSYLPPYNKWNISCSWNVSLTANYSNSSPETLYIPVNTSLTYGNASYNGWLTLSKN